MDNDKNIKSGNKTLNSKNKRVVIHNTYNYNNEYNPVKYSGRFIENKLRIVCVIVLLIVSFYGILSVDDLGKYEFSSRNFIEYVSELDVPSITTDFLNKNDDDIYSDNKNVDGLIKTCSVIISLVIYPVRLIIFFVNVLVTLPNSNILVYRG